MPPFLGTTNLITITTAPALPAKKSPFCVAIESYLSSLKRSEDAKSSFRLEVLSEASQLWNNDFSETQRQQSAERLSSYIAKLQNDHKEHSKTRWAADRLKPLVSGLYQYTGALDVMVQACPSAVVVLYGGARLVLQMAQNVNDCFDAILDMMDEIGHLLQCYELFTRAYEASDEMMKLLVEAYKSIIDFWRDAAKFFDRKRTMKIFISAFIGSLMKKWEACHKKLVLYRRRALELSQATEAALQRQRDEEQKKRDHELEKYRQDEQERLKTKEKAERRNAIIEWVRAGEDDSKTNVRIDLNQRLDSRQDGTCQWINEEEQFKNWKLAARHAAIWYRAGPGSGKTVLSASIVKSLKAESHNVAYFFFSWNDPTKRKVLSAVRCLILQLITIYDQLKRDLPGAFFKIYDANVTDYSLTLTELDVAVAALQTLLKDIPRIHVILDGLDECDEPANLRRYFGNIVKMSSWNIIKWFFASRNDLASRELAQDANAAALYPPKEQVQRDIRHYFQMNLTRRKYCIDEWTEKSDGNFLWARFMLKVLNGEESTCEAEIDEEITKFPRDLTGWYLRSLDRLSNRRPHLQELARRIFSLLVIAEQPLRQSELRHVLGVRLDVNDYSPSHLPFEDQIKDLCGPLVEFSHGKTNEADDDPQIKLFHKSVHDFFLQNPDELPSIKEDLKKYFVDPAQACTEAGQLCITYLSYSRYRENVDIGEILQDDSNAEHAFLKYASTFWFWHLTRVNHSPHLFQLVEKFVRSEAFWTCLWVQAHVSPHLFAELNERIPGEFAMAANGGKNIITSSKINYACPLPSWIDEYERGIEIVKGFMTYIREWQPVLVTYPAAAKQYIPEVVGRIGFPARSKYSDQTVQALQLPLPFSFGRFGLNLEMRQSKERFLTVCWISTSEDDKSISLESLDFVSKGESRLKARKHPTTRKLNIDPPPSSYFFTAHCKKEPYIWSLDPTTLDLVHLRGDSANTVFNSEAKGRTHGATQWKINSTSYSLADSSNVAFHCLTEPNSPSNGADADGSNDSAYNSDSGFNSESDSDFDSDFDSDSDSERDTPRKTGSSHCLIIASDLGKPFWYSWEAEADHFSKITCAFHPKDPIAIWTHAPYDASILDLRSGVLTKGVLPEPPQAEFGASSAMSKEIRFSSDGRLLYYLLCLFSKDSLQTTCHIYLTTLRFDASAAEPSEQFQRTQPVQSITYKLGDSIPALAPHLILTTWSDNYLVMALPPLYSCPKIIRIALQRDSAAAPTTAPPFETLVSPVYFPSSTKRRNPHILLLRNQRTGSSTSSQEKEDISEHLVLSLDAEKEEPKLINQLVSPPIVMTWFLSERGGWREWKCEQDECSEQLERTQNLWELLRGSYVDPSQKFHVPIRSGLDFRRKAYVTCG